LKTPVCERHGGVGLCAVVAVGKLLVPTFDGEVDVYELN
jgi:hypothetical protein